jgi:branched-chain amino acid transport system permease protein
MKQVPVSAIAFLALLFALIPLTGDRYVMQLATEILILGLFAISFNVLLGHAGLVSFGHAAYFAIGGYACLILLTTYEWPLALALPAAALLAMFAALVVGALCVRLTEIYFAMLTLAFGMLVWAVAFRWNRVTGGDNGFVGVRLPEMLQSEAPLLYFTLAVVAICVGILFVINRSAFGQILHASRENPMRAAFVGVNVRLMRLAAFVISGTFSGVAGALFGMFKRSMFPEAAYWTRSADVLIMTIVGGIYSFFGPFFGAIVMVLLNRVTAQYTVYWPTVLGLTLLLILFFMPNGLAGLFSRDVHNHARATRPFKTLRRLLGSWRGQPHG